MARNKKKPQADDIEERWREVQEAAGEGARGGSVWRVDERGDLEYLDKHTMAELEDPLELLRDRYGGGRYRVQLRDEDGKYMAGTRTEFRIAGAPKRIDPAQEEKEEKLERINARLEELQAKGGGDSSALIMVELIRQQGELMRDLRNPPHGAQEVNPLELTVSLISSVTSTFGPLVERFLESREREPDTMSRLEELTVLMELAQNMGGNREPRDGFGVLAKTLGEPIAKLVDASVGGGGAPAMHPNPPAAAGQPAAPGGGATVPANRPPWYPYVAPIVPNALRWAAKGKDPMLRADFIVDELEDEQLGPVHQVVSAPNFAAEFFQAFPQAQQYREWFLALFEGIRGAILSPDELEALEAAQAVTEPPPELGTRSSSSSDDDAQEETGAPDPDDPAGVAPGTVEDRFKTP